MKLCSIFEDCPFCSPLLRASYLFSIPLLNDMLKFRRYPLHSQIKILYIVQKK